MVIIDADTFDGLYDASHPDASTKKKKMLERIRAVLLLQTICYLPIKIKQTIRFISFQFTELKAYEKKTLPPRVKKIATLIGK